jgi:hypothetical protein
MDLNDDGYLTYLELEAFLEKKVFKNHSLNYCV